MLESSLQALEAFIRKAWPTGRELLLFVPLASVISWLGSSLAGWLKTRRNWRTPYTRKIFHFVIFTSASLLQIWFGLAAVVIFGSVTSLFVLYAVYKGESSPFYLALARPSDAPRQKLFILVPLFTTAMGGVLANLFFGAFASIGYLVGGWGDAVGEPVGTRWGKHRYKVPSLAEVPATRSFEGSAAVFGVGSLVAVAGLVVMGLQIEDALKIGFACGAGGMLVEAFSTHGLDNLTIQVAAAGIAYAFLA
jgi:phytol kinase